LNKTFLLRFLAILSSVIFVPFLVTTLQTGHILVQHEKYQKDSIQSFNKMVNPIALKRRVDLHIYHAILLSGINSKNENKLRYYIDWGLRRVKHKPRVSIYSNILLCLQILKNDHVYNKVLAEAKITFPSEHNWENRLRQP